MAYAMVTICREVNQQSGRVLVYEVKGADKREVRVEMKARARRNPLTRYFMTTRENWEGEMGERYYRALKKRNPDEQLERLRGIDEVVIT